MTDNPKKQGSWLKLFIKLLFSGVMVAGAMVAAAIYYISLHPVSLNHFKPFIEETINLELENHHVTYGQGQVVWAGWKRGLDLLFEDVVLHDQQGRAIVELPDLSVELAARPLLDGEISPISVDILNASVEMVRQRDGKVALGLSVQGQAQAQQSPSRSMAGVTDFLDPEQVHGLLKAFKQLPMLKRLREVNILNASLRYVDHAVSNTWEAQSVFANFVRTDWDISSQLTMDIITGEDQASLAVEASIGTENLDYRSVVDIENMPLADLVELMRPEQKDLNLESSVSAQTKIMGVIGQIPQHLILRLDSDYAAIEAEIKSEEPAELYQGNVAVSISDPVKAASISERLVDLERLSMPLFISGEFSGELEQWPEVIEATIELGQGGIAVPEFYDEPIKINALRGQFAIDPHNEDINIHQISVDLGEESQLQLTGSVDAQAEQIALQAKAVLQNFTMDRLRDYWSPKLGTNAQIWVTENIQKGDVGYADIDIALTIGRDGTLINLDRMGGQIEMENGTVQYLKGLPIVTNAKARAVFGENWFDINLMDGSVVDQTRLTGGRVQITDIGGEDLIDIAIDVQGPLREALELLDQEPLGFIGALGLKPDNLSGQAKTSAQFAFPLLNDLKTEEVKVSASAIVQDVVLTDGPYGLEAQSDQLSLKVTNTGMDVEGIVVAKNQALDVTWHESFTSEEAIAQDFLIVGPISTALMDIFDVPYQGYYEGVSPATLRYRYGRDGVSFIDLAADLTDAHLHLDPMKWSKKPGREAAVEATLELPKEGGLLVDRLVLKGEDIELRGHLELLPGDQWPKTLEMPVLRFDANKLSMAMTQKQDVQQIEVNGQYLDLSGLIDHLTSDESEIGDPEEIDDPEPGQAISVSLSLDQLKMDPIIAEQVSLDLEYDGLNFDRFIMRSAFDGRAALNIDFVPRNGQRALTVVSDNVGAVLKGAKLSDRLEGGLMAVQAIQDQPGGPVAGNVKIENFTLVDAPAITKLLEFMSLTGTLSALTSSGLTFTDLTSDFVYGDDRLSLAEGRTFGNSLGLTFEGNVDLKDEIIDLEGTAVPIYTVNRILGAIPILGDILTGGDGGGLFAANYTVGGAIEDPDVSVNPLSALAPGFLRGLFNLAAEAGDGPAEINGKAD